MKKGFFNILIYLLAGATIIGVSSCEEFFDPVQETIIPEEGGISDWNDYRSAELGMYKLQQDLV